MNGRMRGWRRWLPVGVAAVWGFPAAASAESEVNILLNKLVEKGILNNSDAGQIRREIEETKESRNKQLAKEIVPDSARNWKWKGDLRLRDEYRNLQGTGADRHRVRIRFRYGVEAKVNDELKVVSRIATGTTLGGSVSGSTATTPSDEPISTNKTFDDFFRKKPIVLDLAYAEYTPVLASPDAKVQLLGGVMEGPLWTVSQLVWDADLGWDGLAAKGSYRLGETASVFSNNGVFLLDSDESEPATLWVTQAGVMLTPFSAAGDPLAKNFKLTAALAYHDYVNTANSAKAGTDPITRESDNTTATDFNQLNPSVELASVVAEIPTALFWDWVHNTTASSHGNDGFVIGVKLGKATTPWSLKNGWEAGYMFERLERDAAFDEFVDSDFAGGGTNRRGNVAWVTFATLTNSTFGCKYFFNQRNLRNFGAGVTLTEDFHEDRVQLDWTTKF